MTKHMTETEFRHRLAKRAVALPEFITSERGRAEFKPHAELVRLSDAISDGRSLKEIALRAWTYQDTHDLPVVVAARMRTIYRRIMRFTAQPDVEGVA
jgi:hypothetical protein